MSNDHSCVFHQMREQAEQTAAERATCEMTRALHLQLAGLHANAAWQMQLRMEHATPEPLIFEFVDRSWPARQQPRSLPTVTAGR